MAVQFEKYQWTIPAGDQAASDRHAAKVADVVKQFNSRPAGQLARIKKRSPTHQIHNDSWKQSCFQVDVSALNEVLSITPAHQFSDDRYMDNSGDPVKAYAWCEAQVQMGELVTATLPQGLIPVLVPEYTNFTVAGLINGDGIQSSSYKYGTFVSVAVAIEALSGTGAVVISDNNHNQYFYDNIRESYGTIGIVLSARVALRSCKPYVRSLYTVYDSVAAFVKTFDVKVRSGKGDFLEGIVLANDVYVTIESEFVDQIGNLPLFEPGPQNWERGEKFYYQYLKQDVVKRGFSGKTEVAIRADVIPTYDFVFRSMRGAYWMMECHVNLNILTDARWFRRLIVKKAEEEMDKNGGFVSKNADFTIEESQRCTVLQDMGINLTRLQEGIEWVNERLGVYPLWICPVRGNLQQMKRNEHVQEQVGKFGENAQWIVDIGVYGEPTVQPFKHRRVLKELAEFVDHPSTWGVSYIDRDTFKRRFDPARQKLGAIGVFAGREDKVTFRAPGDKVDLDEGPIFLWRLVRDYGRYWPLKVIPFFGLVFFVLYWIIVGLKVAVLMFFSLFPANDKN